MKYAPLGEGVGDSIGIDLDIDVTMTVDVVLIVGVTVDVTVTAEHCGVTESVSTDGVLELTLLLAIIVPSLDVILASDVLVGDGDIVTVADICDIEMTICMK